MFTKRQMIVLCILILTSLGSVLFSYYLIRQNLESHAGVSLSKNDVLRLHVIANSDCVADQELKNKVRDAIIVKMADGFKAEQDVDTAKRFVQQHLQDIEAIAKQEIKVQGKDYAVEAHIGEFSFPTKTYGSITLPAGDYQALRVVIGEGKGSNWWCVLFPPLCFVDMPHGLSTNQSLDEKDIEKAPVQFRLKLLEIAKNKNDKHFPHRKYSFKHQNL